MLLSRNNWLPLIAVAALLFVSCQMALGFSITPAQPGASINYDATRNYTSGAYTGVASNNPISVTGLVRGGTAGFLTDVKTDYTGYAYKGSTWTFNAAGADLTGTFDIEKYDILGPLNNTLGTEFQLKYTPGKGDPIADPDRAKNTVHWIQRVIDNHNITTNPGHGNAEDIVDIGKTQVTPYYDDPTFSLPPVFYDFPSRNDPTKAHSWTAELYLVQETAAKTVTVYNGVKWGWQNTVVPEPATLLGFGIPMLMVGLGKLRQRRK